MEEKIDYKEKKKEVIISGWHTKPKNPYFFLLSGISGCTSCIH